MAVYKRKQTLKNKRKKTLKNKRKHTKKYKGGGTLPVPRGSVVSMLLDPTDEYSAPVMVSKEIAEKEILDE